MNSNWNEQQKARTEVKERNKVSREKLAGFFYNLAQLTFAALVLGGITPIYASADTMQANWAVIASGLALTCVLAYIAHRILNN